MVRFQLLFFLFSIISGGSAFAFPLPQGEFADLSFHTQLSANYDFEGIISLSNCSASLVRLEDSADTDQALVFTNGHCLEIGFTDPGEYVAGETSTRNMQLLTPQATLAGSVRATQIVYSTMTATDLTIYKLKETYAEIKSKFKIEPLVLSPEHPKTGMTMEVISGYWKKGYTCQVEAFIPQLMEAGWTFKDSIRYSRPGCETIGGTSGSPIVLAGSRTQIGVNNTGNEDGKKCTMNNPCEVDANGTVTFQKGYSYGQQTYWVYSCLNDNNELDLQKEGCLLPH